MAGGFARLGKALFASAAIVLTLLIALAAVEAKQPQSVEPRQVIVTQDPSLVVGYSIAGKAARMKFRPKMEEAKELLDERARLSESLDELDKMPDALPEKEKEAKRQSLEERRTELRSLLREAKKDLEEKEDEVRRNLAEEVTLVTVQMARQKGYDLVLTSTIPRTLYVTPSSDISAEVLEAYDAWWLGKNTPGEKPTK